MIIGTRSLVSGRAPKRVARFALVSALALFVAPFAAAQVTTDEELPASTQPGAETGATNIESGVPDGDEARTLAEVVDPALRPDRLTRNLEFPGIRWGSFLAYPEISAAIMHDDNIYAERRNENTDYISIFSPLITLESDWEQNFLKLDAGADIDRYHDFPQEDVVDYWLGADGRIDVSGKTKLFGGARWVQDHEDRGAPDSLGPFVAAEPTVYDQLSADLGAALKVGPASIRFGGTFDTYDYQDVPSVAGLEINMDDRDRDVHSLGARVSFTVSRTVDIFGQYATDIRDYDTTFDDNGYQRSSDGYRAAGGLRLRNARRTLIAELLAGQMNQKYDDPRFENLNEPYFGADLLWRPTPQISLSAFIDRALEESTLEDVSGYLDTTYGVRAERKLTRNLTANGRFAYTRSEFEGSERLDKIIDAGAGLRYFVSPTVYLAADYRLIDRDSNEIISPTCCQYARDQVMLSIGVTPGRSEAYSLSPDPDAAALQLPEPNDFSGFYLGTALGYGTAHTVTEGGRGESGSDVGQMGDDGGSIGIFAGIGTTKNRWYFGVEAEVEASETEWYHQKDKTTARTAYVQKHGAYGVGLRLGRVLERGQVLYLRGMAMRTEFHAYYAQNDPSLDAYDETEEVSGTRLGIGVDIPSGDNLFIRIEYAYSNYKLYDVSYSSTDGTSNEVFNDEENLARLGLGWKFGSSGQAASGVAADPVSGFYAGAQVGPATLESRLSGYHIDGGSTTPKSFVGDFSDQGWAPGAFFGYGFNLERWYLGVELEASTSDVRWEHIREQPGGGGRDFSVEKKSDYGGSLRAGYSFRNATMLYVRAGMVRGRFNTTYNKGVSTGQFIDRTDTLSGVRTGFGAEIPVSDATFLRFDFTHTIYESFSFVTGHGGGATADSMDFDNSENLFRLGLGFRF